MWRLPPAEYIGLLVSNLAVYPVLPPEACCDKDPRSAFSQTPPSNMQWCPDRAPFEVTR